MPFDLEAPLDDGETEEQRLKFKFRLDNNILTEGGLSQFEFFWRDHYSWLKESGYLLRSRYAPGWTPSWLGSGKSPLRCEDGIIPPSSMVVDAIRLSDGSSIALILSDRDISRAIKVAFQEVYMFHRFSTEPLASDPKNHCTRLTEILHVPDDDDMSIIVMPFLQSWTLVKFFTIGEAVEFFTQIFEGLQLMHSNRVWHGDVKFNNIMMDASPLMIDDVNLWIPDMTRDLTQDALTQDARFRTRTERSVKYYWIDFDLSGEHDPLRGPPLVDPRHGGTREVPEFAFPDQQCNPFAVDVWRLGFLVQTYFTEGSVSNSTKKRRGFEFMHSLVADMINEDPAKRPSMDEVVQRFSVIKVGLSEWTLRSRFASHDESPVFRVFRSSRHWSRQLLFKARGMAAIPCP
ncbi:kinase-like domain-containing protein [Mycena leptocephala]|nr:kinase-like domain-containing protein [Mycena leptocephala]